MMSTVELALIAIALLLIARIVQAWIYHERRQRLLLDLATMIGDFFDAVEEQRPAEHRPAHVIGGPEQGLGP